MQYNTTSISKYKTKTDLITTLTISYQFEIFKCGFYIEFYRGSRGIYFLDLIRYIKRKCHSKQVKNLLKSYISYTIRYHVLISYFDIIFCYHILLSYFDIIFWYHISASYFDLILWPHILTYILTSYFDLIFWFNTMNQSTVIPWPQDPWESSGLGGLPPS